MNEMGGFDNDATGLADFTCRVITIIRVINPDFRRPAFFLLRVLVFSALAM
jgi:hypothetical protein